MTRDEVCAGQSAVWVHVPRGGYGYEHRVRVTVVRVGPKRVLVAAPLARGGTRNVWVRRESLGAPDPSGTRP